MATLTSKGQITLPRVVREALGLRTGSQVEFVVRDGEAVMRKRLSPEAVQHWRGFLRDRAGTSSTDEYVRQLRDP